MERTNIRAVEAECLRLTTRHPALLVPWYLMASFAYYIQDDPILTDDGYDDLCMQLQHTWPRVKHRHKHIIDRDALDAGTGHYLAAGDYPAIVVGALRDLRSVYAEHIPSRRKRKRRR